MENLKYCETVMSNTFEEVVCAMEKVVENIIATHTPLENVSVNLSGNECTHRWTQGIVDEPSYCLVMKSENDLTTRSTTLVLELEDQPNMPIRHKLNDEELKVFKVMMRLGQTLDVYYFLEQGAIPELNESYNPYQK